MTPPPAPVRQGGRRGPADEIRVGLAGYGLAGSVFHAPLIAATLGLRVASIATSNEERAASARRDYPGATIVRDAAALIAGASELDLIVVATPNATHASVAGDALAAGLDVVVDKPFAPTAAEGRALIAQARAVGRTITVFQNRRWDGDFLTVQRVLASGELGRVHRFESRFERWKPQPRAGWKNEADAPGSGVLYDLGTHLIDQALVLFGAAATVYAEQRVVRAASAVVDDVFVALTHRNGVVSHLTMSLATADAAPRFRVLGADGSYTKHGTDVQEDALREGARPGDSDWGEEPREAWGRVANGSESRVVPTERGAYERYYAALAAALRSGAPLPVDPADSVAGLVVVEAANVAVAERCVVTLPVAAR